jgi:uncharacterized RDD family membrane protein YckC
MTCNYCGSRNGVGEHRCRRCGRRPDDILNVNVGALATKLQPAPQVELVEAAEESPRSLSRTPNLARAVQRPLFQEKPDSKIIPFESYAAPAPRTKSPAPQRAAAKPSVRRSRVSEDQGKLDFLPALPPAPRKLGTTVDAVIVCEAPVATPLHRAVAAAIDWALVLIAYGIFLLGYFVGGGEFVANRLNYLVFGAALAAIALTYGLMYAIAGSETPGMKCAHLRLTTFDGFKPDGKQRLYRLLGSSLSLCTVLGLAWSLADEESLGWQDHISRTFPTPREVETLTFRRR